MRRDFNEKPFDMEVLSIRRVSKTTTGGNVIRFSILVVIGDKKGSIGIGLGKSKEVFDAIRKAEEHAKKRLFRVPVYRNTVPHDVQVSFGATSVLIKPAKEGTGIIAGSIARQVFSLTKVKNIVCKIIGSSRCAHNVVYAMCEAFSKMESVTQMANRLGCDKIAIIERKSIKGGNK